MLIMFLTVISVTTWLKTLGRFSTSLEGKIRMDWHKIYNSGVHRCFFGVHFNAVVPKGWSWGSAVYQYQVKTCYKWNSQAPPQPYCIRNPGVRARQSFTDTWCMLKFVRHILKEGGGRLPEWLKQIHRANRTRHHSKRQYKEKAVSHTTRPWSKFTGHTSSHRLVTFQSSRASHRQLQSEQQLQFI